MALHLVLILHRVATVEVFADIPTYVVAQTELASRVQSHELGNVKNHIVKNDELLALSNHFLEFLGRDFSLESIDISWHDGDF